MNGIVILIVDLAVTPKEGTDEAKTQLQQHVGNNDMDVLSIS